MVSPNDAISECKSIYKESVILALFFEILVKKEVSCGKSSVHEKVKPIRHIMQISFFIRVYLNG